MADTTLATLRALLAEAERAEAVMLRECGMGVLNRAVLEQARAAVGVFAVPQWHWHDLQAGAHLPPRNQIFVGVNVNGYTCTANATDGDKCWNETPEESIEQMSGLRWWAPYVSPMDVAESSTPAALSVPAPAADKWEGAEEWMPLAWELCADECGEDACNELVWEGGPVPEPWGARWLKYEYEAKRLIALVRKHVPGAAPQPIPAALSVPAPANMRVQDAVAEAMRRRFVKLPRWSFHLDNLGNIRRVDDKYGNWVEFEQAHTLFDPVCVDAAIAAGDAWRSAVDAELTAIHDTADSYPTPQAAIRALIDWHCAVQIDPAVSSDAAALVERGRKGAAAWNPIETAPKDDGVHVLLHGSSHTYSDITAIGYWSDFLTAWWLVDSSEDFTPTHWMPLPDAPQLTIGDTHA